MVIITNSYYHSVFIEFDVSQWELNCFSKERYTLFFQTYASALGSQDLEDMVNDLLCPGGTPVDGLYFATGEIINGKPTYRTGDNTISFDNEVPKQFTLP